MGGVRSRGWDPDARPLLEQAALLERLDRHSFRVIPVSFLQDVDPWILESVVRIGWVYASEVVPGDRGYEMTVKGESTLKRYRSENGQA